MLWVDLRRNRQALSVRSVLDNIYSVTVANEVCDIESYLEKHKTCVLCFEYDLPQQDRLAVLEITCSRYPQLPVVIIAHDHSVELAIWALRIGVRDYFTTPVVVTEVVNRIARLFVMPAGCSSEAGEPVDSPDGIYVHHHCDYLKKILPTTLAVNYVRDNLENKISLDEVSKLCSMSKSHFSRSFKNDHGVTFQNFLARQRIDEALRLLKNTDSQITQIALAVGFSELSNFTRTFQKHVGMSPSNYRKAVSYPQERIREARNQSTLFPKANPNPVLSVGPDGEPKFINPAAVCMLKLIGLRDIESILPVSHRVLVKTCLDSGMPMSNVRKIAGKTIVWSYCPMEGGESVHLYGNDLTDYLLDSPDPERITAEELSPVCSLGPDGIPHYLNPATNRLLKKLDVENVEDILPQNHENILKASTRTSMPLVVECCTAGHTIVWSYHQANTKDVINVYCQEVADGPEVQHKKYSLMV